MAVLMTALAVVLALLAVLIIGTLRSHAEILRSVHALGVNLDPDVEPETSASRIGVTAPLPRGDSRPAARRTPARRGRAFDSRVRAERIDRDLLDAGIEPGHSSLYPPDDTHRDDTHRDDAHRSDRGGA